MKTLILSFVLLLCLGPLTAQIELSEPMPIKGQAVDITLPEPTQHLLVRYRPNSSLSTVDTLYSETPTSHFQWEARQAGIATLFIEDANGRPLHSHNVSVRFQGTSPGGIIVMVLAGIVLFGGAIFSFSILFKTEEEEIPGPGELAHRADT